MRAALRKLRQKCVIGVVGGSDFVKQKEQLGESVLEDFDYSFSENGLLAIRGAAAGKEPEEIGKASFAEHVGEENVKRIVNWVMKYLSDVDIPVKRGTFIEFRNGMLNISPIGRNCSRPERDAFEAYDKEHGVRPAMVGAMRKEFADLNLTFSIGGQISFDVFPQGWDKTYCLRFLPEGEFTTVHFFGDKTFEGGNDYEIYEHERTEGHSVTSPEDTIRQLNGLFALDEMPDVEPADGASAAQAEDDGALPFGIDCVVS